MFNIIEYFIKSLNLEQRNKVSSQRTKPRENEIRNIGKKKNKFLTDNIAIFAFACRSYIT
jgi:hypothetical protein